MKRICKVIPALLLGLSGMGLAGQAFAGCPTGVDLTGNTNFVQFGDGLSFSLPILGLNVQSSPGQINDCLVVTSGSGGAVQENSLPGLADNAYDNLQGSQFPYFRTGSAINNVDPGGGGQFTGDTAATWDVRLSALTSFLNGGVPVFYFNHNQTNSGGTIDQDLFVWAQVILRDDAGTVTAIYNFQAVPNLVGPNFGVPGGDPGTFTAGGVVDGAVVPTSDYVRARGQICLGGDGSPGNPIVPCDGSGDPVGATYNQNLGADNVANAIIFPELNAFLVAGAGGATVMQIDFRMGCNSAEADSTYLGGGPGICPLGSVLNNGFEQLFLSTEAPNPPPEIPEPGTVAIFGLGLAAMGAFLRRRKN